MIPAWGEVRDKDAKITPSGDSGKPHAPGPVGRAFEGQGVPRQRLRAPHRRMAARGPALAGARAAYLEGGCAPLDAGREAGAGAAYAAALSSAGRVCNSRSAAFCASVAALKISRLSS